MSLTGRHKCRMQRQKNNEKQPLSLLRQLSDFAMSALQIVALAEPSKGGDYAK